MRILDLGAHDGYLSLGIQTRFPMAHIDAIELNEHAAKQCNTRISGVCRVGAAEDAYKYFEIESYDVVVAFELIEHVPDIPKFLTACEQMVKPGGQIYISTPDGCFGTGNNPHHLRAIRAVDLADMLRRRGALHDMTVGSDGVTVASYIPGPRLEDIAIYAGPGWEPWHPSDINERGLGGSETAAIRLSEALSRLGFIVTVYGEMREDTCWADVIYKHHTKFDPLDSRGAVISSRMPHTFDRPIAAPTRMLWVHDVDCGDGLTPARSDGIDHVLALSPWHQNHLGQRYPFLKDKIRLSRNGIERSLFEPVEWDQRAKRVLYTSSPDRGLDILLEIWPEILKLVPDAELHHCYADVYDKVADQDPMIAEHRDRIRALSDQPGVKRLGSLPQPELAALMCRSRVWAHPSWATMLNQPFHETSCIGAMEAQAAGCLVVASNWGALTDTVKWGRKVNSDPPNARWRQGFVNSIVEGLTDPSVGRVAVKKAPAAVAEMGWDGVALDLAKLVAAEDNPRR